MKETYTNTVPLKEDGTYDLQPPTLEGSWELKNAAILARDRKVLCTWVKLVETKRLLLD